MYPTWPLVQVIISGLKQKGVKVKIISIFFIKQLKKHVSLNKNLWNKNKRRSFARHNQSFLTRILHQLDRKSFPKSFFEQEELGLKQELPFYLAFLPSQPPILSHIKTTH